MTADSAENPLFMALTWRLFRCPHDYRQFSVRESVLSSVTENSAQRTSDFFLSDSTSVQGPHKAPVTGRRSPDPGISCWPTWGLSSFCGD